jgi:hypothetical protein
VTRRQYAAVLAGLAGSLLIAHPALALAEQPPPPASVEVSALTRTNTGTGYVVTVHNNLDVPQVVEVVQRFVQTPSGVVASDAGQLQAEGITWVLDVPPRQPRAIHSTVTFSGPFTTRSTACLRDLSTMRTLDCAAGDLAVGAVDAEAGFRWLPLISIGMAIVFLAAAGYQGWRLRSRWWPTTKDLIDEHRNGLAVGAAVVTVIAISAATFLYVTGHARSAIDLQDKPGHAIGWSGEQTQISLGLPASSDNVEFTIYRWLCTELDGGLQCMTTVAIRNTSAESRTWFARMQRLQYTDESWIEADPALTLAANGSSDQFAAPLEVGERRVAALVYRPAPDKALSRLELRDGAFARGVAFKIG